MGANIIQLSLTVPQTDDIDDAIQVAYEDFGVLIVCAAGNDPYNTDPNYLPPITYPASNPFTVSVAATNSSDLRPIFSCGGEDLDIAAPGVDIYSTQPNNSYDNSSGTSFSAPLVSGCAGLILSANSNLNNNQVANLLKYKADKVGNYNYDWNYLKSGHSKELGYGRMNCYKSVETASLMYTSDIDLYTRDTEDDFGLEPNETEDVMWKSPDIWVRNQPDGIQNQTHQNPEYSETDPVYVYVRVTNKGETTSYGSEQLTLNWAKASTALAWPENWDGSLTNPLMGDLISTLNIPSLEAGAEAIIEFPWMVPNPADYEDINPEPWHFCLLSRIVASSDPMATPEGVSVNSNTRNNNNIAWKNITIAGDKENVRNPGGVIAMGNIFRDPTTFEIEFKVPQPCSGTSILDEAEVKLTLDDLTYQIWTEGGKQGYNIEELKNQQILITSDPAYLSNLTYDVGEFSTLFVGFNFLTDHAETNKYIFKYLATQKRTSDQMVIGGELFIIHKPPRKLFDADAGEDKNISKDENVVINAENIGEDAEYNWYDMADSLIYSGTSLNVTLDTTTSYKLEVLATNDGFKDYDDVTVHVKQYEITNIAPNPSSNIVTIDYDVENTISAQLIFTMPYNPLTETFCLDLLQNQISIDVSDFEIGLYTILLICDGQIADVKSLIVQ